jgi:hypothetical protein
MLVKAQHPTYQQVDLQQSVKAQYQTDHQVESRQLVKVQLPYGHQVDQLIHVNLFKQVETHPPQDEQLDILHQVDLLCQTKPRHL